MNTFVFIYLFIDSMFLKFLWQPLSSFLWRHSASVAKSLSLSTVCYKNNITQRLIFPVSENTKGYKRKISTSYIGFESSVIFFSSFCN